MLHELYCQRNNVKCKECGEFVNKSELEEHLEDHEEEKEL